MVLGLCYCAPTEQPDDSTTPAGDTTPGDTTPDAGTTTDAATTPAPQVGNVAYYDDYLTEIGTVSAAAAGAAVKEGSCIEIVEKSGVKYFHAKGIGAAKVTDGTNEEEVTVAKAKLNLIVIMGQSNSGNHFANATADITCPLGTAYWWGGGKGVEAEKPLDFKHATMGFHSPLLAELYAQSVKAGNPTKNVLIWHEGGNQAGNGTSKNGSSIYGWASSSTDASGTDYTVKMVKNCVAYYTANSDKYEISSKGVYWLQGEGDGNSRNIDPTEYMGCFMAMWNKLKSEAGLEYMAIMRVRRGGDNNTLNNDIHYSTTVSSQFALANKYDDIFMATTLTENFTGAPTASKSINIEKYITFMETYSGSASHNDSYNNTATYANGVLTTTMKSLFGSNNNNHYGKFGYGLIGVDAAYNMYKALNGKDFEITQADSSGKPEGQTTSKAGSTVEIDITELTTDLAFRGAVGSTAGTLTIKVMSGTKDITNDAGLINTVEANYGCVNIKKLKTYDDVTIVATYTPKNGTAGSVTYKIKDNSVNLPENTPNEYVWDFDTDLSARDKDGNVVNLFYPNALKGTYKIENGILKCAKVQLELAKVIDLKKENNWSLEIKFGDVSGSSGFILATKQDNVVGNIALSYRGGKLNYSEYALKAHATNAGYYNYTSNAATITSNCVMKLVNTYDEATKTSVMSLYKDGVLIVENIQKGGTGDFNGGSSVDLGAYDIYADLPLAFLGCNNSSGSFNLTTQIDYIKVDTAIN